MIFCVEIVPRRIVWLSVTAKTKNTTDKAYAHTIGLVPEPDSLLLFLALLVSGEATFTVRVLAGFCKGWSSDDWFGYS